MLPKGQVTEEDRSLRRDRFFFSFPLSRVFSRFSFVTHTRHAFYWKTPRILQNAQLRFTFSWVFALRSMLSKLFKIMRTLILYCNYIYKICFISREKLKKVVKLILNKNTQYINVDLCVWKPFSARIALATGCKSCSVSTVSRFR